jgi:TM2 domain-containing membrane protein YozV
VFCPNCGTQNPEAAQTCTKCGFSLKANPPKFKGTMLMMNQGAPAVPGGPPAGNVPPPPANVGGAAPPGAPATGAAPAPASRLKGTIVGVAPPTAGGAPAFDAAPPPAYGAPPPPDAAQSHQFGSPQAANPLGATVAFTGDPSAYAPPVAPPPAADPNAGFLAAPAYGAPPPAAPPMGGMDPMGAPPGGGYGAGAPPPGFGGPQGGFGPPPGQPGYDPMNPGAAMQPYPGGPPVGVPGMGMVMGDGSQKSFMTTLLLALFAGTLGVHRFYTGHTMLGVLQLVTCGGLGIWTLVDIISIITGKYTDAQGRPLLK